MAQRDVARDRAVQTFEAMRAHLYHRRRHLYGTRRCRVRWHYEPLWPFADAWSATATLWHIEPDRASAVLAAFPSGLLAYAPRHGPGDGDGPRGFECQVLTARGGGGERFYDDNAWVGLALVAQHRITGDEQILALASRVLDFCLSGWADEPAWSHPGGIRWKEPASCTSRNTCANGPVAELALLVHAADGRPQTLESGRRVYEWVRSCLLADSGLYLDRITPDGRVAEEIYSYNQGTMVGAGVLLHRLTGERSYLDQARATASAAMAHFGLPRLLSQDAAFAAVWFRNLLLLDEEVPDPSCRAMAEAYLDARWHSGRDPHSGLFPDRQSVLNATAPMLEIAALLAGAPPHP